MASGLARRRKAGTSRGPLFLLLMFSASVQSKYATGARRVGRKLVDQTPLEEWHVANRLHCLALCNVLPDCRALNFGRISAAFNCQLLAERACSGHQLVADPSMDYYDVSVNQTAERQASHWDEPVCVQDGYCSADCVPRGVGEACVVESHCQHPELPVGSHLCLDRVCQPKEGFWEVRPGLLLPRWMSWTVDRFSKSFKKLKAGQCELEVKLKLGVGAQWQLLVSPGYQGEAIRFGIDGVGNVTDIADSSRSHRMSIPTADIVNTQNFTQLKLSWCNNTISMGPVDNTTLLSIAVETDQVLEYVTAYSERNDSWMYIDSGVADPWLFDASGTDSDPVFEMSGSWSPESNVLIGRYIDPSDDVTVKYDCMAANGCHTYLYSDRYSSSSSWTDARLKVVIGGYGNTAYELLLQRWPEDYEDHSCCHIEPDAPICNGSEFVTFTVRYKHGRVTIFRNDDPEPAFNDSIPAEWLPYMTPVSRVAFGSYRLLDTPKRVRVARYDAAWATDTWRTQHSGFSSMAFDLL